jgi:pyruvyltransferase
MSRGQSKTISTVSFFCLFLIHFTHISYLFTSDGLPLLYKNMHDRPYTDCKRRSCDLPLYFWIEQKIGPNFGDIISLKLVERIVNKPVRVYQKQQHVKEKKLLAIGSILTFAAQDDVVWGSGINGKWMNLKYYKFTNLDVRAVRGPLTRDFLMKHFNIACPETYGDPALLLPYFFPEFKRKEKPSYEYLIIPHYSEQHLFPKELYKNVVYPTEPWDIVLEKILDSAFVIAGSLHGIIAAEAYGIPARMLRVTENEHIFKFQDYYLGTGRPDFQIAYSLEEALRLGGEKQAICDLLKLYQAFPCEFWCPDEVAQEIVQL